MLSGFLTGDAIFTVGFTGVSLAAAIIVLAIAEDAWFLTPVFASLPMRALGRVSYGVYLWHGLSLRIAFRKVQLDYGKWGLVVVAGAATEAAVRTRVARPGSAQRRAVTGGR